MKLEEFVKTQSEPVDTSEVADECYTLELPTLAQMEGTSTLSLQELMALCEKDL